MFAQKTLTKDLFLLGMSCIYLFAFSSLYVQIPGLYGDQGLLPVKLVLLKEPTSVDDFVKSQPSFLRFMPRLGLSGQHGMDLLAVLGIFIAFMTIVYKPCRDLTAFGLLWILYFSIYQVGQTFLWFQWDILMLEAGFLTILVAPLNLRLWRWQMPSYHQHDAITMWLIKWLLFRLMFASGVVKLTSECPTWWGLTAMNWHYESQCIPTMLSWYFHQLPTWFQAFSTVVVYVIEIVLPFLFFIPIQGLRIFAFYSQIFFMVLIILTGNYNFFNLLTIVLNISLLDDDYLRSFRRRYRAGKGWRDVWGLGWLLRLLEMFVTCVVYVSIAWYTVKYFNLRLRPDWSGVDSKIAFTKTHFYKWLDWVLPITIYMGLASLAAEIVFALVRSVMQRRMLGRLLNIAGCLLFGLAAGGMFAISLVPHLVVSSTLNRGYVWPSVKHWHDILQPFAITHSYGLFRSMTGVGGRPEVVIEGSMKLDSGWQEYEFLYKPGNVSRPLGFVAPHQPRLDWQMWFAALGNYQHNHWFVNLAYRLLNNQPEVLALLERNPFVTEPPKYLRASLYTYHYTSLNPKDKHYSKLDWWWREYKEEYLPVLTKDEPTLVAYLKHVRIVTDEPRKDHSINYLTMILDFIRQCLGDVEGFLFTMSLFVTALVLNRLSSILT